MRQCVCVQISLIIRQCVKSSSFFQRCWIFLGFFLRRGRQLLWFSGQIVKLFFTSKHLNNEAQNWGLYLTFFTTNHHVIKNHFPPCFSLETAFKSFFKKSVICQNTDPLIFCLDFQSSRFYSIQVCKKYLSRISMASLFRWF